MKRFRGWPLRPISGLLSMILLLVCVSVPAFADNAVVFGELSGKTAGVLTGTPQDDMVTSNITDPTLAYYDTFSDVALALRQGKIDYFVNSTISFRIIQDSYPDFGYLDAVLRSYDIGAVFPRTASGEALRSQYNEYIAEITEDGTLAELQEYWLNPNDWENIDIPKSGVNGTLQMGAISSVKPFAFKMNGEFVGFDIAIAAGFCREYGYGLSISDSDFAGVLSGIASGRYDFAASQISWTEERAQSVLYSDFYCHQDIVPIVLLADYPAASGGSENNDTAAAGTTLAQSFRHTLIDEGRWQLILSGLGVTLFITIFGFALANVLGALLCAAALSKRRWLRLLYDIYSRLMQGTPIVIILMILYYIIFAHTRISGELVAIIAFGITSGAYLAQLFFCAITEVPTGQKQASLAMGFTPRQTFTGIVLPQAVRTMLPGYFSQLITLLKGTAVVGYIAVIDLTKTGDIIQSSTFEPFFPLLVVAAIYFIIAALLLQLLKQLQKKLAPKRAENDPKGGAKA